MSNVNEPDRTAPLELLLASVNRSAEHLQRVYLQFTLVWTYYIFVVGTTTHRDLLLGKIQKLPILDVSMSVVVVYTLGPVLFLVLHAYLLAQHRLIAPQSRTVREWPDCRADTIHVLRDLLIFPSPFAHLVAGTTVGRHANSLLTVFALFVMPLLLFSLIVYFFLPYHGKWQTAFQLLVLAADMLLLGAYWPRIAAPDGRWKTWWNRNVMKLLLGHKQFTRSRLSMKLLLLAALGISLFGIGLITPLGNNTWDQIVRLRSLHVEGSGTHVSKKQGLVDFIQEAQRVEPDSTGISDAVVEIMIRTAPHYALSERDLRHAYLFGMDLRGANLQGADLRHADLRSANLEGANLRGARLDHAQLEKARLDNANLKSDAANRKYTTLNGTDLKEVSALGASFNHAHLPGAFLGHADLRGADLSNASFRAATLTGANLRGALLERTDLAGANLTDAHLQGGYLNGADLTVTNLHGAHLNGASLFCADLPGANLSGATLRGADLRGGRIAAVDTGFHNARIDLADIQGLRRKPLGSKRCDKLRETLEAIGRQTEPARGAHILHAIKRLERICREKIPSNLESLRPEQPHFCDPDTGMAGRPKEPVGKHHKRLLNEVLIPLACADGSASIAQRLLSRVAAGDFHERVHKQLACALMDEGCAARDKLREDRWAREQINGMLFDQGAAVDFLGDSMRDLPCP